MPDLPPQPVAPQSWRRDSARESANAEAPAAAPVRTLPVIPERYALRRKDGVRYLECDDAPRLRAIVRPGMSVSRAEAQALGRRTLLLDGAGSFGPLIDNERQLYNLDHHAGCERLFTLATCEQALLLVQGGLELSDGDWTLYANEPDLDTVLAIWCLLNHRRLRELRPEARDVLLPLLRLEGAIDANGHELSQLCGLPGDVLEQARERLDTLLERGRELEQAASRGRRDALAYTLGMLRAVDALVYRHEDFGDYTRIEEVHGHAEVGPRQVAVACRDGAGIYMVEQHLKERWGDQLCLIALENEPRRYTLRRVRSVAGPELEPAYDLLNKIDPAVDGRPPQKRWGGSGDIGGSPRPDGTLLSAEEVLESLTRAYRSPTGWQRLRRSALALGVAASFLLVGPAASALQSLLRPGALPRSLEPVLPLMLASLLALGVARLAIRWASARRPWVFGLRAPANGGGWWLSLLVPLGAVPFAASVVEPLDSGSAAVAVSLGTAVLALGAAELWFRGLVHGLLVIDHPIQRPRGPWLLSRAAVISAAGYGLWVSGLLASVPGFTHSARSLLGLGGSEALAIAGGLGFGVGLCLAVLRERSLSLLPGFAIQALALLAWGVAGHLLLAQP